MQSKITQIEPKGTYTNASGTFNKYQVYLANGNNYQFLAKGEFKKQVGETIDFEITNEQYTQRSSYITNPYKQHRLQTENRLLFAKVW